MREIVSPLSGIRSPFGGRVDPYKVAGFRPALVADMSKDYFRNPSRQTFDTTFTTSRLGNATMVDSDGLLKWAPHNLLTYSEDLTQAWSVVGTGTIDDASTASISGSDAITSAFAATQVGAAYTIEVELWTETDVGEQVDIGFNTNNLSNTFSAPITLTATPTTYSFSKSNNTSTQNGFRLRNVGGTAKTVKVSKVRLYRSDLGGMVNNPDRGDSYVPTTSTAKYLPRRHNHTYNGSAWVDAGTLIETEARTQLLHTTNALVTQSHTVTAVPHTLHFTGTGTVTLSGASTAGPLVGTGTGEENRVSLTFTPTAASLTLTVTGTVTDAQLEVGSKQSSYIPNLAGSGTVNRAADSPLTVAGADVPWGSAVCIQMEGDMTYADEGTVPQQYFVRWFADANNNIRLNTDTSGTNIGQVEFVQFAGGVGDSSQSAGDAYSPGINVPFNIASRHGSTFVNGAVGGTALTADTTPVALPDLSSTDLEIAYDFMGNVKQVRVWAVDIGDTGIAEASA